MAEKAKHKASGKQEADNQVIDIGEACSLLGISIKTFQKLLREENIPARKIGREWRFSRPALIDWVGQGESKNYKNE